MNRLSRTIPDKPQRLYKSIRSGIWYPEVFKEERIEIDMAHPIAYRDLDTSFYKKVDSNPLFEIYESTNIKQKTKR